MKYPTVIAVLMICITSVPAAAQLADTPWPMFHHDLNHTGLSTGYGPDTSFVNWTFSTGTRISGSAAIGEDGTIYIGTRNYQKPMTGSKLYAIYPNGTEKWHWTASHFIDSTPAVASDGTVYMGSWDKCLYALYPNGTKKWELCTHCGGFVLSSPAIAPDGTIYVGSNDKKLYAIYPNGTEKWSYPTGQSIQSSPAIGSDGIIYVGSCDKKLYAIYPNGTEKWSYPTGQSIQSSPAIDADGTIYVGSNDKKIYAIYPDGTEKWNYTMGGEVESSPAIDADGTIYVGSNDKKIYAIYPDGTEKWSYTMGGEVESSPAIDADGTIYVGSKDGYIYAVNPNGTLLWKYYTGTKILHSSPAIAADGTVYIGNWDGDLYAFGPGTQPPGMPNRPPTLDPVGNKTINETETVMIDLNATDPDGDSLTYSCNRTNLFTDFDPVTGTGNWTTGYSDSETYWIDFGVSDGKGGIDNETIRIDVLDANRAPVLDPVGNKTINETETVMIDLNTSDQDGDTLTYSCNRTTDLFTDFDPVTGTGNWSTGYGDSGTYYVDFGVSDSNGGIDNETIEIDVLDSNRPPVLDPVGDQTINETETVMIDLNTSDQDGDALTYSCNRTDLFADFNSTTGTGNWTTGYSDSETYWVNFGVSDGNGGIDNETIRIDVLDVNEAPVLDPVGDSKCRNLGERFDILINITPMGIPLMGVQFDLQFNAGVLHAETVTYGDFLTQDGWTDILISHSYIDNLNGVASFAAARQETTDGVTSPGTFAIVHFTAIKQNATSELVLNNVLASDNSTPVVAYELEPVNGSIEVCDNLLPFVVAKSLFTYNNIAEKGLSKAYFDGTESYDLDGTITLWEWWVDDGTDLVGETAEHLFEVPMYWHDGHYVPANVTLAVIDNGMPLLDNSTAMEITVWIAGDANGDGRVNIGDTVTFGMQFGNHASINSDGLRWYDNPEGDKADLNNDGWVNIGDAMLLGTSWGHTTW